MLKKHTPTSAIHYLSCIGIILLAFLAQSCQSNLATEEEVDTGQAANFLQLKRKQGLINEVKIYRFWGNQQILVFEDSVKSDAFFHDFSKLPFPAVYRIYTDNEVFDLIYNNEPIEVILTATGANGGIEIKSSTENERYYSFLKEFSVANELKQDSICLAVKTLRKNYTLQDQGLYSTRLIKFLLNSTFNCNKLSPKEFIARVNLKADLMATPYISDGTETIVKSFLAQGVVDSVLFQALVADSIENPDVQHFIRSVFWNLGVAAKSPSLITTAMGLPQKDTLAVAEFLNMEFAVVDIGGKISLDSLTDTSSTAHNQLLYFIADMGQLANANLFKNLKEKFIMNENVAVKVIDSRKLSLEERAQYNLIAQPILLRTTQNHFLIDRFLGNKDIELLIDKKI